MITQLGRWTQDAACARADRDPRWWDPEAGTPDQLRLAARICAGCPVRYQCAEDAEADRPAGAQVRAGRVYGYGGAAGENPPTVAEWLGRLINRTCIMCGRKFTAPPGGRRVCSDDCDHLDSVEHGDRYCAQCSTEFTPTRRGQKYCGRECSNNAALEHRGLSTTHERECRECGNTFTAEVKWRRYCSPECKKTTRYRRDRERRASA